VVGANGSGKSTLLRILAGLDRCDRGSVRLERPPVARGIDQGPVRLAEAGYLPQEPSFPGLTSVGDYLSHVAWVFGVPSQTRQERVAEALAAVGLSDRQGTAIRQLSGGMRRRLGVAQALIGEPAVLVLDEPTAGLDPAQRSGVMAAIRKVSEGRVVVVATHSGSDVAELADRLLILRDGSAAFDGVPGDLTYGSTEDQVGKGSLDAALASILGASEAGD
jgi:ABC-2 type transport system ATP-binding protein